jgi:hypothetical protein
MKRIVGRLSLMGIAALLLCCSVTNPTVIQADDDPTPPTSPTEVQLPRDNTKAIPQDASNGWTKIEPGSSDSQKEKAKRAKKIKVALKKKQDGKLPPEEIVIRKIGYYKKNTNPPEYVEEDITSVGSANQSAADIEIPADADTSKPIYVRVYAQKKADHSAVVPEETLNKDFAYMDDGGAIVSIEHGGGAVVSVDGEVTTTILDVAANELSLSASDFEEPDLMFWCTDLIETGEILFCPVGEFRFANAPEDIVVFDSDGADLVAVGAITLGTPYVTTRGDLALPVTHVEEEELPAFGLMARGVQVEMNEGADEDSVNGYTTGGSSLRFLSGDTCLVADGERVLDNWEVLSWSTSYSLGSKYVEIDEEEVAIGAFTSTVSETANHGYLEGIVIEGNAANSIKNGQIILRGIWGCQFGNVEPSTRVHVLDADTGNDLYHEEISAEITASEFGDLVVTLNNIESYCASNRIKIVITGVYMAYNAPVAWGVGYTFQCFGSSLRGPLRQPRVIIEGEKPTITDPSGPLPQSPIEVEDWTPIAAG